MPRRAPLPKCVQVCLAHLGRGTVSRFHGKGEETHSPSGGVACLTLSLCFTSGFPQGPAVSIHSVCSCQPCSLKGLNSILLLPVWRLGRPRSWHQQQVWLLVRTFSLFKHSVFSLCLHMTEGVREPKGCPEVCAGKSPKPRWVYLPTDLPCLCLQRL